MKFLGALTLLAAGLATAATSIPYEEEVEWRQCSKDLLNEFKRDSAGDKAACNMWDCLHYKADQFNRGGFITKISNALTPFCIAARLVPDVSSNLQKTPLLMYLLTFFSSALGVTPLVSRQKNTVIG